MTPRESSKLVQDILKRNCGGPRRFEIEQEGVSNCCRERCPRCDASQDQSALDHQQSLDSGAFSRPWTNSFGGTHPVLPSPASGIPRSHPSPLPFFLHLPFPFPRSLPLLSVPSSSVSLRLLPRTAALRLQTPPAPSSVGGAAGWLRAGALGRGRRGGGAGGLRAGARRSAGHGLARASFPRSGRAAALLRRWRRSAAPCFSTRSASGTWPSMCSWCCWRPWGCGMSSSASRRTSAT